MSESSVRLVELQSFHELAANLLDDLELWLLQEFLAAYPEAGDRIPSGGGLRKLRWSVEGKGKRGGVRVIYYYKASPRTIYFVTLYAKSRQSDLTPKQLKALAKLCREELK